MELFMSLIDKDQERGPWRVIERVAIELGTKIPGIFIFFYIKGDYFLQSVYSGKYHKGGALWTGIFYCFYIRNFKYPRR